MDETMTMEAGKVADADAGAVRLCLGGGDFVPEGYINIDRRFGGEAYPLEYPDDSVDEVYASHILEHFPIAEKEAVLAEWVRVLKPGGVLKIAVPDLGEWARRVVSGESIPDDEAVLYGGQCDANDYHRCGFEENGLRYMMRQSGLLNIHRWDSKINDCAALDRISLNLQGTKPHPYIRDGKFQRKVCAVLTAPRVGFIDPMRCVSKAFRNLNIPLIKTGGAYFCQGMDRAFQSVLDETDAEYILSLDYDTLFDEDQVLSLLALAELHKDADAIVSCQIKRECSDVLVNVPDEWRAISTIDAADLVPIEMGHFGLSIFRSESLRRFKKPWFIAKPAPDGGWGDGRVDADVNFWRLFREQGFKPYMAPWVSVGHMQLVATWPGRDFQPVHQFMSNYDESGQPKNARH